MNLGCGRRAFNRINHRSAPADGEIDRLTEWLGEVADLGVHSVLMLDEAEHLPSATAQQSLVYLLSNLPTNLQVVIASRVRLNSGRGLLPQKEVCEPSFEARSGDSSGTTAPGIIPLPAWRVGRGFARREAPRNGGMKSAVP